MPIVTQSRLLPFVPEGTKPCSVKLDGVEQPWYGDVPVPPGQQVTTSYRSRGRNADWADDVRHLSGDDLRRELRKEAGRAGFNPSTYDNGNEFHMEKTEYKLSHNRVSLVRPILPGYLSGLVEYDGPMSADIFSIAHNPGTLQLAHPSQDERVLDGTKLVKRVAPTAPSAGLAQILGELREGIPSLTGMIVLRNSLTSKTFGKEYVNYQFALAPMISDIKKLALAVKTSNKAVRQYLRDSGRNVRRRRVLYDTTSYKEVGTTYTYASLLGYTSGKSNTELLCANPGDQRVDVWDTSRSRAWFSGAFTYHVPEGDSFIDNMARHDALANKVLGTRFTASLVWELTPWSWLIDWFWNFGTFVSNAESFSSDGLVMRYGYVMHHSQVERTYRISNFRDIRGNQLPAYYITVRKEVKSRLRASPYGFGLKSEAFSPRQWAILGALGISSGGAPTLRLRS